ncbi:MAG: hypothetical protein RL226_389, partial [Bacteroidota bacterium]
IYQSSNFEFSSVADFRAAMANEIDLPIYTRGANPTVRLLEKKLAALQGTEDALCFGSGSAAVAAAVLSFLRTGDHVVCVSGAYSWTQKLFNPLLSKFGVDVTYVDGRNALEVEAAFTPQTRMLYLESPTSITFACQDVRALAALAKQKKVVSLIDNTYGSILNTFPVEVGVDVIIHSATKFISGHSDVVAGVVCASKEVIKKIFYGEYMTLGATLSPHDAWLLIRSLRTIEIRMRQGEGQAQLISDFLQQHPAFTFVHDPFSTSHPDYSIAKEQFKYRIPMFSFEVNSNDEKQIEVFCNELKFIRLGVSWGGYESLLIPTIVFPHRNYPVSLMRLYVGFESGKLLCDDLHQAAVKSGIIAEG